MNYAGYGRTGYFPVHNEEEFRKDTDELPVEVLRNAFGHFALLSENEDGSFERFIGEDEDELEKFLEDLFRKHVKGPWIVSAIYCGHEGMRYLDGGRVDYFIRRDNGVEILRRVQLYGFDDRTKAIAEGHGIPLREPVY